MVFALTQDAFAALLGTGGTVSLSVDPLVLAVVVLLSVATLLASAWIPARRAGKGSAVDAIRQAQDVNCLLYTSLAPWRFSAGLLGMPLWGYGASVSMSPKQSSGCLLYTSSLCQTKMNEGPVEPAMGWPLPFVSAIRSSSVP